MASVVYQGLQTCLEPRLLESSILTHKSSSNPTHLVQNPKLDPKATNGFSFLSLLEKPTATHVKNEEVYVHPMAKRSASALSKTSLEMCTESLGTETGSDEFMFEEKERSKPQGFDRKMVSHRGGGGGGGGGFPPPLTSIRGSECTLNVRPHREGGRLVIKAVSVSDCGTKFESERIDGRLKLSLLNLKGCCVNVESRRAKMKISSIEKVCCESDVGEISSGREMSGNMRKHGGKTGARLLRRRLLKRPPGFPNSDDLAEFELTGCKDGGNSNKVMKNWSLLRVVIP